MKTDKMKQLAISENGFIFDPETGYSYNVNETGHAIFKLLQKGMDKETIAKQITKDFDISKDHFDNDYEPFVQMLEALDLVEED